MVINNDININNDITNVTKKNIDSIVLMLGKELRLDSESLIFYHSSPKKFEKINNIGNWFSPIKIKERNQYYRSNNIFTHDKPLWNNQYDFRFINKKPLKLLSINTYSNDIDYSKLINMIDIININVRECLNPEIETMNDDEEKRFLLGQEKDSEYLLAYYLCKYSSFDGWITNASYLGFCMLKKECLKKLKLLSVTEPPNSDNVIMYYTSKQWKEHFI